MKPIQITMDPQLVERLDAQDEVKARGRSAVIRDAVEAWLQRKNEERIVAAYRAAYGDAEGLGSEWEGWEEQGSWLDG
jgi:metal-responsive CopG/Arc/MetJ family transcriptional regulator